MGLYDRYVVPRLVNMCCTASDIRRQRQKVVPHARGEVFEVGIGSGLNLPFYDPGKVTRVRAVEPSDRLRGQALAAGRTAPFPVEVLANGAESVPYDNDSMDTVVVTYTLCSIPDLQGALSEMRRILRPDGQLLFVEHGLAPAEDAGVRRQQRIFNPVWRRLGGGCHLNRDIPAEITRGGFAIDELETMYLPGVRFLKYNFWGNAHIAS